ncbi:MAG: hypothetical protein HYS13_17745 [Planctomycetia bacterium]|nr:hypothetical protein [Planctomycetia bacterium]
MSAKPRLLLVEDLDSERRDLCYAFEEPPHSYVEKYGISSFEVQPAVTGAEAVAFLREAAEKKRPYDVVTLDLGLSRSNPSDPQDKEDPQVGLDVLRAASDLSDVACGAVVIYTQHGNPQTIIRTFRGGAADFVPKPSRTDEMFAAVCRAYRLGQQKSRQAWRRFKRQYLLQQMKSWMCAESQAEVASKMGRAASDGIEKVLDCAQRLEQQLGLGQFPGEGKQEHALAEGVEAVRRAAFSTLECCNEAYRRKLWYGPQRNVILIGSVVEKVIGRLGPGIAYKRLLLEVSSDGEYEVCTFPEDLFAVIDAVVFSGIDRARRGTRLWIQTLRRDNGTVAVSVECEERGRVGAGLGDRPEDRALELAKRLAHDMGGGIRRENTARGCKTIFYIPVSSDVPPVQPSDRVR